MNEILVSIVCNAYNHELYIADAIESFLRQKTDFKYEILIYDDASLDKTAEIIKQYEKKYPDIIKPIYQLENQYSKGIQVVSLNENRAIGKYIALCEGDDYWTDPYKLQKQTDFLDKNSEYSICVHAATIIDANTNKKIGHIRPSKSSKDFSTEEVITGGGGLFATNSMVYRREGSKDKPDFYNNASIGDYPLMIFLSLIGKVYYMHEDMSIYRSSVYNSWTDRTFSNIENQKKYLQMRERMLKEIDKYTKNKYTILIENQIQKNKFYFYLGQGKIKEIKDSELIDFYNKMSKSEKFKVYLKRYSPNTLKFLKKLKERLF